MKKTSKNLENANFILRAYYEFQALLIAEYVVRALYGVGLLQMFKNIYGEKRAKEGYTFDTKLMAAIDKRYNELNKVKK